MTTRRALIKTAAWVAPTALVSVAAPAVAASVELECLKIHGGSASYNESKKETTVKVKVKNSCGKETIPATLTITSGAMTKTFALDVDNRGDKHTVVVWDGHYPTVHVSAASPGCKTATETYTASNDPGGKNE